MQWHRILSSPPACRENLGGRYSAVPLGAAKARGTPPPSKVGTNRLAKERRRHKRPGQGGYREIVTE